ncbi:MAG: glucosylglycerol 3-phosphatase [Leptolyngbya sp. SIO4C1]|nr:glucosylglycerol 3-phosphatase [Leptolyngbya sp. SIO4C1]
MTLHQQTHSLDHEALIALMAETANLLIVQDLDGVCMGLVKDPLSRVIDMAYIKSVPAFEGNFFVLTNGEHIGQRGINGIIERAFGGAEAVAQQGLYLPGLAAGGVQWQNRYGKLEHPGVSDAELAFLAQVPDRIEHQLRQFFAERPMLLSPEALEACIQSAVLDNVASPTVNLNTFYETLRDLDAYVELQQTIQALLDDLLAAAKRQGLGDSFFVHYAPNLGRDENGQEVAWWASETSSGTTDFQFMLRGAIKEAGVLALLNHYYFQRTGKYPLGVDFNARQAPHQADDMLALVEQNFDPALMPTMIGVGDTVTSQAVETEDGLEFKRGGSDRNFLQLIQAIGQTFESSNLTVYVDSSGGELKNRKPVQVTSDYGQPRVVEGPRDLRDSDDPLTLNVVFPGGHLQYCQAFQTAAQRRISG